jgi:hypothetical protein
MGARGLGVSGDAVVIRSGRARAAWVLLVTDGTVLEFAPEFFVDERLAAREARRWAVALAMGDPRVIRRPFEDRWEVGPRDIRLVRLKVPRTWGMGEPWVGTHWTRDGYPDPEAVLLEGKQEATAWARTNHRGQEPTSVHDDGDELVAVFGAGEREEHSRVNRLKEVTTGLLRGRR